MVCNIRLHVCLSQVENEHYSIMYFDRIRGFKALYLCSSVKGGLILCYIVASICEASTQHIVSPALKGNSEI